MNTRTISLLLTLLSRCPLAALQAGGRVAGVIAWMLSPGMRRKTRANLETAGLYGPGLAGPVLALRSAAQAGATMFETAWVWLRPEAQLVRHSDFDAVRRVIDSTPGGRILLTPHLGAYELAGRICAHLAPITVLYKAPRREDHHALIRRLRTHDGMTPVPAETGGVRALLKALHRGESVGILPDQVPSQGDGEWAPFFGRPAFTMTLPSRLAAKTSLPVYLLVAWRGSLGRGWRFDIEALPREPTTTQINASLEQMIRRDPSQYLWSYNRYKQPPRAEGH